MTISFPRDIPSTVSKVTGTTDIKRNQATSVTGLGPDVVDIAPPMWRGQYSITAKGRAAIAELGAWLASLRGGLKTFKGVPIRAGNRLYRWPLTRPRGFSGLTVSASPWDGTGNLSAIGTNRDTITINGLPNGLVMSVGDFVSFPIGSRQHLFKVVEGGAVSGNAVTLAVEPTVRPDAVGSVSVQFEYPYCEMSLSGDYSFPEENFAEATASFTALQRTR